MSDVQFYYDWNIGKLETTAQVGDFSNVVTRIYWELWGSDEFGNRAPLYGETEVPTSNLISNAPGVNFVQYEQLTREYVEDMLEDILGEDEIARLTDNLKIQLEQIRQTTTTTAPPPWLS